MEQLSIFDYIDTPEDLPLGYLKQDQIERYKGDLIPFRELEHYIGQKVLYEMPRQGMVDYKVIMIKSYYKDCDTMCLGDEELGTCDRIGYSDDNRRQKENSWVSEHFFKGGRFSDPEYPFANQTFKIKG